MSTSDKPHVDTMGVHAGQPIDAETGAVANPLHMSSTFERAPDGSYASGYVYGRSANPTRGRLETALAALEGGAAAASFASGMAAVAAVLQALAPGDHILLPDVLYHGVATLAEGPMARWGLKHSRVDMTDPSAVQAAITPATKLIWTETPANPGLDITDVAAIAKLARAHGIASLCDATWVTPVIMRPLELGVDLVLHSTTKYIAGHSDVTGGAIIARDGVHPIFENIRTLQSIAGGVPSPFDCWLTLRGLQTLGVRVRAQTASATRIANWLAGHPKVSRVLYPGLASHPGHEIAQAQMPGGFGGMLSFIMADGEDAARHVAGATKMIVQATSLGGTHTLIEHRATIEGESPSVDRGLLRLSIGLEHADDIIQDLEQAMA